MTTLSRTRRYHFTNSLYKTQIYLHDNSVDVTSSRYHTVFAQKVIVRSSVEGLGDVTKNFGYLSWTHPTKKKRKANSSIPYFCLIFIPLLLGDKGMYLIFKTPNPKKNEKKGKFRQNKKQKNDNDNNVKCPTCQWK